MDANRIIAAKGNAAHHISDAMAVRISLAMELRNLADEIENGEVIVTNLQTFESAISGEYKSMMTIATQRVRKT